MRVNRTRSSPHRWPPTRHPSVRAILIAALATLSGLGCGTSTQPPPAAGPPSQVLAYQDSNGTWNDDTAGVVLPVIQHRVPPGLPARAEQVSGAVSLKILVTRSGAVDQVVVTKNLSREMDQEAVKAVRQWRYSPATLRGESVAVWMTVTVTYHVTG